MKNKLLKSSFYEKLKFLLILVGVLIGSASTPMWAAYYVAGDSWGGVIANWSCNDSKGLMTNTSGTIWSITFASVSTGNHQFKITNGTWDNAIGWKDVTYTNCTASGSNNGNITFNPTNSGAVTITYNSSNDKITITCASSTYTVTYNGNGKTGGSVPTDANNYSSGATVTVKGNTGSLVKTGCVFDGWMTAQDGTGTTYAPGATFSISGNTTLYARWIAKTIYVYNNLSWNTMKLYTFNSNRNGGWPGTVATSLGSKWYRIDILDGASQFIVNNKSGDSGSQSVDLNTSDYTAGRSYETYNDGGIKLREKKLTVSFNMKSHGSAVSSQNIYYNGLVTEPSPAPSATGYTFGGWYKETGCTNVWNFGSDRITAARTLYAKWTAKNYTVPLNANDASATDGSATVYFDGTSMTIGTEPTLTGYHVAGYYKQAEKTNLVADAAGSFGSRTVTGIITSGAWKCSTNNTPLYTEWEANTYYVSYNANGGSGTMTNSTHTYGTASNLKTCTFTAPSGKTFAGWATSADGSVVYADGASVSTLTSTNGGTYPLFAKWDDLSGGSVTLNAGTGGKVSKDNSVWGASATITDITSDQAVNIYAQANTGYTFSTWTKTSGSGSVKTNAASGAYNAIGYANDVVTASFTENMSALSVSRTIDKGSPSIAVPTVAGSATDVGYVTTRTITAAAAATGYALTSWTITNGTRTDGGGATANPITVRSNGDGLAVTVTANYAIQSYTISASNSNVTYSPSSGTSFKYGATGKKMTITPKSGYKITAINTGNVALTASADNNAAGSWTVTGTMPGTDVTLTVTTAAVSTIYLQGRFRIRTASGVESYKSLGSATASGWKDEWVTGGTSLITMTYNYITGFYDLVTYRSAAELKADGNLYFYLRVGSTNTYPTSDNLTVPSSIPGSANAQTSTGRNFYFNDNGDYINVVLHYDASSKKLWYTGEAETTYSTTCYAGDRGSINVKGTAISKNSSSSINIGTSNPISATPESGYSFDYWETTGSVTVADIYSATTTVTATAASGTVRAHYLAHSGWYLQGGFDDYDTWETSAKNLPVDRPYRGISGVYYRPFSTLDNNDYFGMHDGTNKYSGHESTSSDYNYSSLDQVATLYVNSSKSFQAMTSFSNKWAVIKTTGTKKFWIQSPATYYTLSVTSAHGTVTLTENNYGGLETNQFASGDRVNISVTASSGYWIDDIELNGTPLVTDRNSGSWSGSTTMPAGNATLTVTYNRYYTLTYDANYYTSGTGGTAPSASSYVSGSNVTVVGKGDLTMTNYTFSGWNTDPHITGTNYAEGANIEMTGNITLYGVWKRTIPFELEDADPEFVMATVYGTYNCTTLTDYDNPTKDGYTFGGWWTNIAGGDNYVISPEKELQPGVYHWTNYDNKTNEFMRYPTSISSLYAKWTQTVTLNANLANHGSGDNTSATIVYKATGKTSITHCTPAAGYHLVGYYTAATDGVKVLNADGSFAGSSVTDYITDGKWTKAGATTLYAHYEGNTYTVTLAPNGGSGSNQTVTATYDAAMPPTLSGGGAIVAPNKTGYAFGGYWYESTQYYAANLSSVTNWNRTSATTLNAKWTPNTYAVSFNVNGGTASKPDDKEVTYDATYGTLPSGMTHTSKQFIGWYTDPGDGEGTHITAETIVSTAGNHTLYAHYENVYSVNVNFKCGSDVIYPSTSVNASPTSLTPEITAPEVFGYSFVNWTGSNVTFADASSATTTITATAATSVTANYEVVPTVYFKNNLGWENVYVTFDSYWKEAGGKQVPGNKDKPYYKMTQIGSSDVYYCVIPETYTASDYAGWAWNIAFDNTNYGSTAETTHTGTYDPFYGGKFTGRGDFDPKATMFIPYNGDTETRNGGTFYKSGCWMKYNSTESGYQVKMNEWVTGAHDELSTTNLTAPTAGGYEFSAIVNLPKANYSYGFKLYKEYKKNTTDLWYTNTGGITHATDDLPWAFWSGSEITADTRRCGLHTEALGNYKITVSFATGKPMVSVEYPVSTGDWKLIYKDLATWSGVAHTASWNHPSRVIKAKENAEDIVSFYVAYGSSPSIELYKCTAIDAGTGAETWTKQSDVSLTGISKNGVYNFKVSQNGSKEATVTLDGEYDGNFYIRTDASNGGWTNYKTSGKNLMTYSEYSLTHGGDFGPYSHYFMRFASKGTNIKFCIANDYSECITDTVVNDTYTGEFIAADGNVRFMWNSNTNKIGRTYISGSTVVSDRFLVLEGDAKMFDESGNALTTAGGGRISGLNDYEMKFTDDENWIYEATVKAQPTARIKLTAKYNDKIQYFYGEEGERSESTTDLLIGGSGSDKYKMRIVYDFKTNRLMRAFIPDATITTDLAINADLMIIREHQEDAQQITFSGGSLSEVKTVYGAMKFNKYTVNGKSKESGHAETKASRYERDLFYISFPFDVKLSDAFGFGEYGKHWIIEYYDGKGRAEKGFWADSKPNWKFVMPAERNSFTMKAFEGYILALELDEMTESSDVWDNGVEDVYVYFPSDGNVNNIAATNRQITIDQTGYECTINRNTPDGNRTVKDSYWHCIGVPSFANYSRGLTVTDGGATIDWSDDDGVIDWTTPSLPYLYKWNSGDNSLSVTTSATFDFKATWSYLVQYAGTSIYWSQVNVTPASIVARERTAPTNAEFRIELQQGGEKADQTFVRLTEEENVTTGFDFNYDLSKEYNKNRANIYTMVTTVKEGDASVTQSAANVLPMSDQTTVVPVGVKIATTGDYTFAIPEGTAGVGVTLIDNETGIRTSLSALDYTINLSAGTYENRFVLEISPIKQMPTDIESVSDQHSAVRKVMIDGILYIVKDGKVFDAHGNRVK